MIHHYDAFLKLRPHWTNALRSVLLVNAQLANEEKIYPIIAGQTISGCHDIMAVADEAVA